MSVPQMPKVNFSCTYIARLLADKLTPDFNFKEQLWFIARANAEEAAEYLCLLLRTQFDFQPKQYGESFFHHCLTGIKREVHRPFGAVVTGSNAKNIARRALVLRDARQRLQNDPRPFPFLQLPFDIRLQVYEFVFINNQVIKMQPGADCSMAAMADGYELQGRSGIFGKDINTALLVANQQIFNEAEPILYQTRFLIIGVYLVEGLRFLRSLSPRARRNIRAVNIALPMAHFRGAYDEKAWCQLCYYMSQNLRLRALSLNLSAEPPPTNFVDAAWVKYLVMIRGLKHLQPKISFFGLHEPVDSSEDESDPELDPGSQEGLDARRQALISFLKSEMCQYPASRLLTEKEELWDWKAYFSPDWAANEGFET